MADHGCPEPLRRRVAAFLNSSLDLSVPGDHDRAERQGQFMQVLLRTIHLELWLNDESLYNPALVFCVGNKRTTGASRAYWKAVRRYLRR